MKRTLGPLPPIALALALGAGLAAGCHKAPPPAPTAPARAAAPVPTPTPVSDTVVFVREGALWAEHSDGASPRLLALPEGDEDFWFPAIAPDGSGTIAWLSRGDGTQDLVRVDWSGKVTTLTDTGDQAAPAMKDLTLGNAPTFSPDGSRVAYGFNGDLWIMDADGLNAQTLTNDGSSWSPAWSPDGKRIAYVNGNDGHRDLWVMDVGGHGSVQLTDFGSYTVGGPRWSPDGQRLLMTRSHGEDSDIVAVPSGADSPATDADPLTHDHLSVSAAFNPLGNGIVFSSARVDGGDWNLYTEDASGSGIKAITQDGGLSPDWSKLPLASLGKAPTATPSPTPKPTPRALAAVPIAPVHPAAPAAVTGSATPVRTKKRRHHRHAASPVSGTAQAARNPAAGAVAAHAQAKASVASSRAAAPGAAANAAALPSTARLRFRASFNDQDQPDSGTEAGLKDLARRVKPYASYTLDVIGPLDESDLKGLYFSEDSRSRTRAQAIGTELAKLAGFPASAVKAEPYSPPAGGMDPDTVVIYVELR